MTTPDGLDHQGLPPGAVPLAAIPLATPPTRAARQAVPLQPSLPGLGGPPVPAGQAADQAAPAVTAEHGAARHLTPEGLRALLRIPFTDEQLAAVCAPAGPHVIVAGAGSGKTSVMAARVVWLVAGSGVPAEQILGLTFTRKAAGELAERVRRALAQLRHSDITLPTSRAAAPDPENPAGPGGAAGPDAPEAAPPDGTGEPTVSTYNAFAARLVADHALRLGLEPDAALLPAAARYQLAAHVARGYTGRVEAFTGSMSQLVEAVVALDGQLGEHLVEPDELIAFDRRWLRDVLAALDRASSRPRTNGLAADLRRLAHTARRRLEVAELVKEYRAARHDRELLDFGDQIRLAARLAEQVPAVGAVVRGQFRVVLLDEYQDTSVAQHRLLARLFGGGHAVTAVGDPAQAIYGWRGASASNLARFPTDFPLADGSPAPRYELTVNQRGGGRLLTLANAVAADLPAESRSVVLAPRPGAELAGETIVSLHATWSEEVAWVAREIAIRSRAERPGGGAPSCAVLARSWADVPALVAALTAADVAVEVLGLGGLLVRPEIADIRAMLEVLDDPTANPAMTRLLTGPRLRLGPRDLASLGRRAVELLRVASAGPRTRMAPADPLADAVDDVDPSDVVSLADALADPGGQVSAEAARRLRAFAAELAELRGHVGAGLVELVHRVVETTGLDVELELAAARAGRGREHLAAFLRVAADFERSAAGYDDAGGRASLTSFLGFLRAGEQYERGLEADLAATGGAVQVLTLHGSKGLEWDVVAVPDISRSVFPDSRGADRWTTSPATLPTELRGDADDLPVFTVDDDKAAFEAFAAAGRALAEREERRLAYVAFTRARTTLIASGHWWGPAQKRPRGPSPFLLELRAHAESPGNGHVDGWADTPLAKSNPDLDTPPVHPWPAPLDPAAAAARHESAAAVRALLTGPATPAMPDDPAGMSARERALLADLDQETRLLLDEELATRAPVLTVPLPAGLTATQVTRLRSDPEGLARELVRPLPRRPVAAASRGTRFHAWVEETFDRRPLLDYEDLPGADDEYLDDAELRELKDAFLAGPYAARQPFAVEAPFELPLAGRVVRGRIDAVYDLGAGRFEVVDWKTGAASADPVQLALYRLAWARLRGIPPDAVDAAFYYVRTSRVVRPPLLSEDELVTLLSPPAPRDRP